MRMNPLGRSGLIVSDLALGTMIFGEDSDRSTPPGEAKALIRRYLDAGGNHLDTARDWTVLEAVADIARARDATQAQIALAWLRGREAVSTVLFGARTMKQLEENLGAATIDLTDAERHRLDEASAPPERYPYRMIEDYGAREDTAFGT